MTAVLEQRPDRLPLAIACHSLGLNRSTVYAHRKRSRNAYPAKTSRRESIQPRALSPTERQEVVDLLHSQEFCDQPPFEVYSALLEQGRYLCSPSSMHRYLRVEGCTGERRHQRPAQHHAVPRLSIGNTKHLFAGRRRPLADAGTCMQRSLPRTDRR